MDWRAWVIWRTWKDWRGWVPCNLDSPARYRARAACPMIPAPGTPVKDLDSNCKDTQIAKALSRLKEKISQRHGVLGFKNLAASFTP